MRGLCDTITVLTFLGESEKKNVSALASRSRTHRLSPLAGRGGAALALCVGGGLWPRRYIYIFDFVESKKNEAAVERAVRGVFTHTTQHYKQKHTRVTRGSRDRELHRSGATHDRGVRGDADGRDMSE